MVLVFKSGVIDDLKVGNILE